MKSVSGGAAEQTSRVSLADVGLLVVVFLLVCSTFAIEDGLLLRLPAGEAGRGRASGGCMRVVALAGGGVEIDGRQYAQDDVGSVVRAALARDGGLVVLVEWGRGVGGEVIAEILGEVRQTGATRISLNKGSGSGAVR